MSVLEVSKKLINGHMTGSRKSQKNWIFPNSEKKNYWSRDFFDTSSSDLDFWLLIN